MTTRLRRMAAGVLAGAVGTLAMDLVWYGRYRRGGTDGFLDWEFATSTASFDEAAAPGKVGQRVASALGIRLPDSTAGFATNVVHWLTGMGYGAGHGLLADGRRPLLSGVLTGSGAFANSYATLGLAGIYEPIWRYDRQTIAKDLSAHLVFGVTTAVVHRALDGRDNGR